MDEAKKEGGPIREAPTEKKKNVKLEGTEILCFKNKVTLMIRYISVKYKSNNVKSMKFL